MVSAEVLAHTQTVDVVVLGDIISSPLTLNEFDQEMFITFLPSFLTSLTNSLHNCDYLHYAIYKMCWVATPKVLFNRQHRLCKMITAPSFFCFKKTCSSALIHCYICTQKQQLSNQYSLYICYFFLVNLMFVHKCWSIRNVMSIIIIIFIQQYSNDYASSCIYCVLMCYEPHLIAIKCFLLFYIQCLVRSCHNSAFEYVT